MKKLLIFGLIVAALLVLPLSSGAAGVASTDLPDPLTPEPASPVVGTELTPEPTDPLEGVILTRTPEPTATPGIVEQEVERFSQAVGLGQATFLGLEATDWINLLISVLYVLAGYLIGTWLIRRILPRIVRRTKTDFDDQLLDAIGGDVRWLVVILALYFATMRLTFFGAGLKVLLGDAYFVVGLAFVVRIIFELIGLAQGWADQRMTETGREVDLEHVAVLLARIARIVTVVVASIVALGHFGVDVTALTAALGLGGLAISLAAQDTISDMISGVIILVDQPFRVGDRIELQEAGTWGDVLDIGLRTTRIRTRDNRVVILPNSTIGSNQVTNYSYPDPSYRSETHLSVGYDTDLEVARDLIVDTVRGVKGVVASKPVDALYIEMGSSGIVFRVRWWLATYQELRHNSDRVHTALQAAFDRAGIPFAPTTRDVNIQVNPDTVRRVSSTFRGQTGANPEGKTDV